MRLIFYQSINRPNRARFPQILIKNDEYFLDSLFQEFPNDEVKYGFLERPCGLHRGD